MQAESQLLSDKVLELDRSSAEAGKRASAAEAAKAAAEEQLAAAESKFTGLESQLAAAETSQRKVHIRDGPTCEKSLQISFGHLPALYRVHKR